MATETINGRTWIQRQSEGEYRLHQCYEFSGRYLTTSSRKEIPAAYKKASADKVEAYNNCARIAKEISADAEAVVLSVNIQRFVCGFYTKDLTTGQVNRVYWMTQGHRYFANIESEALHNG